MKHKHAELIKAWADGAEIQISVSKGELWEDAQPNFLVWNDEYQYRIKPKPKPDVYEFYYAKPFRNGKVQIVLDCEKDANLKLTWESEFPYKLKSAEVLK